METEAVPTALTNTSVLTTVGISLPPGDDESVTFSTYALAVIVASCMFLITVIPNIMIILLVIVDRKLRRLSNYYIISLATADCIVGAVVMPCMASYSILGFWALGSIICDLWITFDFMCCTASMLSLCMISLDRYWAITQPLKHMGRRSRKRAVFFVAAIWMISTICWVPAIIFFRILSGDFGEDDCVYLTDPVYVLISAVLIYYAPMFAMVFLYANVYITVRRQYKSLETFEDAKEVKKKCRQGAKVCGYLNDSGTCVSTDLPILPTNASENPTEQLSVYTNHGFTNSTQLITEQVQNETMLSNSSSDHGGITPKSIDIDITGHSIEPCGTLDKNTTSLTQMNDTLNSVSLSVTKNQATIVTTAEEMRKLRLRKSRLKQAAMNRRTARTLGIIVILFLICWLPFVVLFPINAFCSCVPGKLYDASYWLAYLNSTLNPFLYGFSRDFRRAFRRLFCKRCMPSALEFSSVDDFKQTAR